jgi:3-(3-hydroxy-phenyl)propionate hydroxylase
VALYPYAPITDRSRRKVIVVGAGPVGLVMALDLALRGVPVLLIDDQEGLGEGSRAICFSKRTLEICDRLGAANPMLDKGVLWSKGKVFRHDRLIYDFDLLPEDGHQFPAFINLSQVDFETMLITRLRAVQAEGAPLEFHGGHRVSHVQDHGDHVALNLGTPDGTTTLTADYVVACDGARSPIRAMLGLGFQGRTFEDNFLIADVCMQADFPTERWFWFDPHFKSGASALLHKQPDGVWRIDFQLGSGIDRKAELEPAKVRARVAAMLGPKVEFDLVWTSIYAFQCRRIEEFRHGRILFAGDAAHQVSPFGARGANSGIQDADNLGWKLATVLAGASDALLDTYSDERVFAADENILNSTRATDFISPKSPAARLFRDAVLDLAETLPFARRLVNSGRLSVPATYDLNSDDAAGLPLRTRPGAPLTDAPVDGGWLLDHFGQNFALLALNQPAPAGVTLPVVRLNAKPGSPLAQRYLGDCPQALYLIRPDQHIAARWSTETPEQINAAHATFLKG